MGAGVVIAATFVLAGAAGVASANTPATQPLGPWELVAIDTDPAAPAWIVLGADGVEAARHDVTPAAARVRAVGRTQNAALYREARSGWVGAVRRSLAESTLSDDAELPPSVRPGAPFTWWIAQSHGTRVLPPGGGGLEIASAWNGLSFLAWDRYVVAAEGWLSPANPAVLGASVLFAVDDDSDIHLVDGLVVGIGAAGWTTTDDGRSLVFRSFDGTEIARSTDPLLTEIGPWSDYIGLATGDVVIASDRHIALAEFGGAGVRVVHDITGVRATAMALAEGRFVVLEHWGIDNAPDRVLLTLFDADGSRLGEYYPNEALLYESAQIDDRCVLIGRIEPLLVDTSTGTAVEVGAKGDPVARSDDACTAAFRGGDTDVVMRDGARLDLDGTFEALSPDGALAVVRPPDNGAAYVVNLDSGARHPLGVAATVDEFVFVSAT